MLDTECQRVHIENYKVIDIRSNIQSIVATLYRSSFVLPWEVLRAPLTGVRTALGVSSTLGLGLLIELLKRLALVGTRLQLLPGNAVRLLLFLLDNLGLFFGQLRVDLGALRGFVSVELCLLSSVAS